MMAAGIVQEDGDADFRDSAVDEKQSDGLLTVVAALDGDAEAKAALESRMEALRGLDRTFIARRLGSDAIDLQVEAAGQGIEKETLDKARGLVLVRTTGNSLERDAEAAVVMKSAAEHTRGIESDQGQYVPRGTVHFTLNHRVVDHIGGSFDGEQTVLAPLDQALEANGRPIGLAGIDTYFATGPGEGVALPGAVVVRPGGGQDRPVIVTDEGRNFKSEGFRPEDAKLIAEAMEHGDLGPAVSRAEAEAQLKERLINLAVQYEAAGKLTRTLDMNAPFDELVAGVYDQLSASEAAAGPEGGRFDKFMASLVKGTVIDGIITEMGGQPVQSDAQSMYIVTPGFDQRVQALATELDAVSGLHSNDTVYWAENAAIKMLYGDDGRDNINAYLSSSAIPGSLRRLMINDGLLRVRRIDPYDYAKYNPMVPQLGVF
jgi:hypothetical protein